VVESESGGSADVASTIGQSCVTVFRPLASNLQAAASLALKMRDLTNFAIDPPLRIRGRPDLVIDSLDVRWTEQPVRSWSIEIGVCVMAPRANWKGYLKLSLVSCPIALYPATSESEKVQFYRINRKTGHRIKMQRVDAETGEPVRYDDIIKGYELGKDRYIEITDEELEAIGVESTRTIEIDEFVPKAEIDQLYNVRPYYVAPEGKVGQEAFAVIRQAIDKGQAPAPRGHANQVRGEPRPAGLRRASARLAEGVCNRQTSQRAWSGFKLPRARHG
jgi:hypothetical protein